MKYSITFTICFLLNSLLFQLQLTLAEDQISPYARVSSCLNVRSEHDINSERIGRLYPGQTADYPAGE